MIEAETASPANAVQGTRRVNAEMPVAEGRELAIALLTGGSDRPYALGLTSTLSDHGITVEFIGSDDLDLPEFHVIPRIRFRNLRGNQRSDAPAWQKASRILVYYVRLIWYAAWRSPRIFHILWNNKFEHFDRTLLMLYYRLLGKRIAFTAHNVNSGQRDANDNALNQLTLRIQYRLSHHIFVHTEKMRQELLRRFPVEESKVSVIPFGINNTVPTTDLTVERAKHALGVRSSDKTLLFFGHIAPYKGLEYLISALHRLVSQDPHYRLIIAGKPGEPKEYWRKIEESIAELRLKNHVITKLEFIPDRQTEVYFKAADALMLPYTYIFQSGVLFLGYSFGLPVIASDVGSLRDDVVENETGYMCRPMDAEDLARAIAAYFSSSLYRELPVQRQRIRDYALERHSWERTGELTAKVYRDLLQTS
jgi:glycosyltransferase involved in cell wall biosynthesis